MNLEVVSIETYTSSVMFLLLGLFLVSVLIWPIVIYKRIKNKEKTVKFDWIVPYLIIYSVFAQINVISAAISYDDIASPGYQKYANWKLHQFIFNDIRLLLIFLLSGVLFNFIFNRVGKKELKTIFMVMLNCFAVCIILFIIFLFILSSFFE